MKRVGYITDKDGRRITLLAAMGDYGNVQKAYNKARKCKRHRKDVLIFTKDKEENLDKVREDILNLAYEPSEYHYFKVYEPKERQIMALPFYDRVVQHAINNVLEPIFDKRFISQSYACRKGKGMHAASDTLKEWLYEWNKYHPDQPLYAIKADIHHYFQSIDHAILKAEIRNLIGFIPEQARTYLGLDTVGVAEFFALLYIAYEVVSIFKNMALCGLPVKKVWEKVREFLAKYTDELPDTDELDGDSTTGNVEEHRTQER